jgi:hypothetical protein
MVAMDGFLSRVDLTPFGSGSGTSDVDQCVGRLTVKNVRDIGPVGRWTSILPSR